MNFLTDSEDENINLFMYFSTCKSPLSASSVLDDDIQTGACHGGSSDPVGLWLQWRKSLNVVATQCGTLLLRNRTGGVGEAFSSVWEKKEGVAGGGESHPSRNIVDKGPVGETMAYQRVNSQGAGGGGQDQHLRESRA